MTDSPGEIDREIMIIDKQIAHLRHEERGIVDDLRDALGLDRHTPRHEVTDRAARSYHKTVTDLFVRLRWTHDRVEHVTDRRDTLEKRFRRHPWPRYLVVPSTGVVHTAPACAGGAVRAETRVAPIPHLSGQDPATVARQVARPCRNCFPGAGPWIPAGRCPGSKTDIARPGVDTPLWSRCQECGAMVHVTAGGLLWTHRPPRPTR